MSQYPEKNAYAGKRVFLVGIKGTGMAALAELLSDRGAYVTGSDTGEKFYTDEILDRLGISYLEEFSASHIDESIDLVVHSAAYSRDSSPELGRAALLRIPIYSYPEMLGMLSLRCDSTGIAGVHGKSTTTALAGAIIRKLNLPASVIAGTAVPDFDDRSTFTNGGEFFVAETCEYRRHFLKFHPDRIIITNIELDHTDYFSGVEDVEDAFLSYGLTLPADGEIIYCADDPGAERVACRIASMKPGLSLIPYGVEASGPFRISRIQAEGGRTEFSVEGVPVPMEIRIPGVHNVLNATAAIALVYSLLQKKSGGVDNSAVDTIRKALSDFSGSRRRSQIVGERDGILFIDDYGHHPTAIRKTIAGYRRFYPDRRIVVDFMPHLYSRTKDLFDGFVTAFDEADIVVLHGIYSSAREQTGQVTGADLYREIEKRHRCAYYFEKIIDAEPFCAGLLTAGDVFITMGAGDNWKLGLAVLKQRDGQANKGA